MRFFAGIFTMLAILGGVAGFFFLSEATFGVGVIALALLSGVLARIAQASANHSQIQEILFRVESELRKRP